MRVDQFELELTGDVKNRATETIARRRHFVEHHGRNFPVILGENFWQRMPRVELRPPLP